jgi:hypothetical protein
VNEDGSFKGKGATGARIPHRPFSGSVDDVLTLAKVDELTRAMARLVPSHEEMQALRERVAAAPAKIEAAKARGADAATIKAAEMKLATLQDELGKALWTQARYYLYNAAYFIGRDFRAKAGNGLADVMTPEGGSVIIDVPGVLTFRMVLNGPDDEIPF